MFATIMSALGAIIALPGQLNELIARIEGITNAIIQYQRVQHMEAKIAQLENSMKLIAAATTDEERADAVKELAKSTNG